MIDDDNYDKEIAMTLMADIVLTIIMMVITMLVIIIIIIILISIIFPILITRIFRPSPLHLYWIM